MSTYPLITHHYSYIDIPYSFNHIVIPTLCQSLELVKYNNPDFKQRIYNLEDCLLDCIQQNKVECYHPYIKIVSPDNAVFHFIYKPDVVSIYGNDCDSPMHGICIEYIDIIITGLKLTRRLYQYD